MSEWVSKEGWGERTSELVGKRGVERASERGKWECMVERESGSEYAWVAWIKVNDTYALKSETTKLFLKSFIYSIYIEYAVYESTLVWDSVTLV